MWNEEWKQLTRELFCDLRLNSFLNLPNYCRLFIIWTGFPRARTGVRSQGVFCVEVPTVEFVSVSTL